MGSAWHHGYWRSYFSHAAITHPANDGLREEFSTAWDIVRKQPAVVFRQREGRELLELRSIRLDMPIVVGPLPFAEGCAMEVAYLEAAAAADEAHDIRTRTLVVLDAGKYLRHAERLWPFAPHVMVRLGPAEVALLAHRPAAVEGGGDGRADDDEHAEGRDGEALRALLAAARIVELDGDALWAEGGAEALERAAAAVRALGPHLLLSVWLRHDGAAFWSRLEAAAGLDHVALVHVHSGVRKSYRLVPRVDAFLKDRLLRARVQLVSAGGDRDSHASAASVYEAVLLGANGGAMTHAAAIALAPDLVDVVAGSATATVVDAALAAASSADLAEMATCTPHLLAAQHPRLPELHGHRRRAEDVGQHDGGHDDRGLGQGGGRAPG